MNGIIKVLGATLFMTAGLYTATAYADCDCGRTDPANPCSGTSASRTLNGNTITYTFNADGEECRCGRFVNGDAWVVPVTAAGRRVSAVTITGISPDDTTSGAMVNPDAQNVQGLLTGWDNYRSSLNIMTQLPYDAAPGASIIKAFARPDKSTCLGYGPRNWGCLNVLDILTVLDSVPPDNGSTVFRPPYAGTERPLRSINNVLMERLPRIQEISDHASKDDFGSIVTQWSAPTFDMVRYGGMEIYRALSPFEMYDGRDYAADIAAKYLNKLLSVFGTEPDSEKAAAVYALMQPGFDNYAVYKAGFNFSGGAGQHIGKKMEIAFAAAMYDGPDMLATIRQASAKADEGWFQEDMQIYMTPNSTTPLWGDGDMSADHDDWYWRRFGYDGEDNVKTMRDPYGYIDGPAHGIHGSTYQDVANGPYMSFCLAMHLMPYLKYANNDWEILAYIDRVRDGRGIDGFDGGWWGAPDPCAAKEGTYGVDYGPDAQHPGDCIKNGTGRFTADHGTELGFSRGSQIAFALWDDFRDCADPEHPSYPCEGLGARVDSSSFITDIRTDASELPVHISPAPVTAHAQIRLPVAAGSPVHITDNQGRPVATLMPEQDNRLYLWDGRNTIPGLYVYSFEYCGSIYSGKFVKAE